MPTYAGCGGPCIRRSTRSHWWTRWHV